MIKIPITKEDIKKCRDFAFKKVGSSYDRLKQSDDEREKRIFFGKLGELIFLKLLNSKGINLEEESLFEIWEDITKGDKGDFKTKEGKSIDIKTAYLKKHIRILVPYDQFENGKNKEFYVGIKINEDISEGEIFGFCSKDKLIINGKKDFGEGLAYWEFLNSLEDIELLIKQF